MAQTFYTLVNMTNDGEPYFGKHRGDRGIAVRSFTSLPRARIHNERHFGGKAGILATTVGNAYEDAGIPETSSWV